MAKKRSKKKSQLTTAQQLGSLIKSARDIMRKDKGLNGDLDRLPMLTWIMFLKFLDDFEKIQESKAALGSRSTVRPSRRLTDGGIGPRRRAGSPGRNSSRSSTRMRFTFGSSSGRIATRRTRPRFRDCWPTSATSRATTADDRRDVIATVFSGVSNRMESGYLLRDVVNKVNGIHFNSTEEIHTLGHLYESMLREMRDAAGDSGEFYTPRPSSASWWP